MRRDRLLILGGTTESRRLAEALSRQKPELEVILSLAGRTRYPSRPPCALRVGGFGGVTGLERYLEAEAITAVVDATHPFARRMKANAARAAVRSGCPVVHLIRPPWQQAPQDRWTCVESLAEAFAMVETLGLAEARLFLAIGRQEAEEAVRWPCAHLVIRSIEPLKPKSPPPPGTTIRTVEGFPGSEEDEAAMFRRERIDALITKNSGGEAGYGKLLAARALGLPVLIIDRPPEPAGTIVRSVEDALTWIMGQCAG